MFDFIKDMSIIDVVDILTVSFLLYLLFLWFKRTKSVFIFVGIIISSSAYLIVRILGLRLVATLMQGFFAVILVAIVVIFQEEIRKLFEQIALFSLTPKLKKRKADSILQPQIDILTDTVLFFAKKRIGAIIVLKGKDAILRNIQRGITLNGELSTFILKSIFDTHSDGHDGAVIIENNTVLQFASHLPLSKEMNQLQGKGTRHAAALGLSEMTDALCIVVSETTGEISIFQNGKVSIIKEKKIFQESIERFYKSLGKGGESCSKGNFITVNIRQKTIVIALSVFLWWFFVHESTVVYRSFEVPVQYVNLAKDLNIDEMIPKEVKVVLSAPKRNFYFVSKKDVEVSVKIIDIEDLNETEEGNYDLTIKASDVTLPGSYTIVNIFPRNVKLRIKPDNNVPLITDGQDEHEQFK
ncbi:MAG: diadenylate cyclase [Candidatus Omnitrophota bacterium]|nr:diadenylate cyclase [Candidatus Omnitrophota bacterium]